MKDIPKILLFFIVPTLCAWECGFAALGCAFTDGCRSVWVCVPTLERGTDNKNGDSVEVSRPSIGSLVTHVSPS